MRWSSWVLCARPGTGCAMEEVFYNGSTFVGTGVMNPDAYTDVTYKGSGDNYMASRAGGGVAEIGFSGGWNVTSYPVGGTVFRRHRARDWRCL